MVRRFGEAMNSRQFHLLDEIDSPEFERHCQATPNVTVRNLDHFKEFLRQNAAVFPDSIQTLQHVIAEGDMVAVGVTYEGTQMGPFRALGKGCGLTSGPFSGLSTGKLLRCWSHGDNMAALSELGYFPPPVAETIPIRGGRSRTRGSA